VAAAVDPPRTEASEVNPRAEMILSNDKMTINPIFILKVSFYGNIKM
jgi:hypothetical protein